MFCVEKCWTCKLQSHHDILLKTYPERSQKVGTALTLREPSENVVQILCVSWDLISPTQNDAYLYNALVEHYDSNLKYIY